MSRPSVFYSSKTVQNPAEVAEDLSKSSIKDVKRPPLNGAAVPPTRNPLHVPQKFLGALSTLMFEPYPQYSVSNLKIMHMSVRFWTKLTKIRDLWFQ